MMVNVLQKGENISLYKLIPNLSDIIVAVKWAKKTMIKPNLIDLLRPYKAIS
jgi:hypothetical protein